MKRNYFSRAVNYLTAIGTAFSFGIGAARAEFEEDSPASEPNYPYGITAEAGAKANSDEIRAGAKVLTPLADKLFVAGEYSAGAENEGEAKAGLGQRIRLGKNKSWLGWNIFAIDRENETAVSPGIEVLTDSLDCNLDCFYSSVKDADERDLISDYSGLKAKLSAPIFKTEYGSLAAIIEGYSFKLKEAEEKEEISGIKAGAAAKYSLGEEGRYGELTLGALYDTNENSTPGNVEARIVFSYPGNSVKTDYRGIEKDMPFFSEEQLAKPKPKIPEPASESDSHPKPVPEPKPDEPSHTGDHWINQFLKKFF